MIDVLIQTFNEERNLPHTLRSLEGGWIRHVFVVDSGSTDRTKEIAEEWGATVIEHAWEGYARQKNWALANVPFEADWVLIVDADEAVDMPLREKLTELSKKEAGPEGEIGFQINRVFVFNGSKIWHCGYYPSWNLRFFRRGMCRYEDRRVHEHMVCDGKVGFLDAGLRLIHEDRRGLEHFFAKHNRYSTLEALELFENPEPWPGFGGFFQDQTKRRRFLKSRVLPLVPFPWSQRMFYMLVLRGGILDGRAGIELSNMISIYEVLIRAKYREVARLARSQPRRLRQALPQDVRGDFAAKKPVVVPEESKTPGGLARAEGEIQLGEAVTSPDEKKPPTIPGAVPEPGTQLVAAGADDPSAESWGEVIYAGAARSDDPAEQAKPFGGDRHGKAKVSVVIPTLNESKNLARCLDHLTWADEVAVVDSGSRDDTAAIAERYGAKVIHFHWNGRWPKKKNWALREAPLANDWVLIVDADEWIMPELAREVGHVVLDKPEHAGFYVNRRFIFMGRWIKHCGYYPSWNLRLIRRGQGEYERLTDVGNTGSGDNEVHEHVVPKGPVGYLDNDMLHFAFPNIHTFMEKHNRYSNWEAIVQLQNEQEGGEEEPQGKSDQEIGDVLSRRRRLKNLSRRVPFRPTLRFLYAYGLRGGFLDGKAGYVFCRLLAIYEYLSVAKHTELVQARDDAEQAFALSDVPPALGNPVVVNESNSN
ncbi:MAG: glycosyltransferase family 2 protein [Planctomycetota bacterium]